jgi:hypothetical protein
MLSYAFSSRDSRHCFDFLAGFPGVASAINKTSKPIGNFCDFHECIGPACHNRYRH